MNMKESINATKKGFEESFSNGEFYNKQTQDLQHLNSILDFLPVKSGMKILDLGVGSGYMSFPLAKKYPDISIVGLDIVEKALEENTKRANEENLQNLRFVSYDGCQFPFEDDTFDMVITRYALHHFPNIQYSISQVSRVMKPSGLFFISDPTPNENDVEGFVDAYMQLKKDGHIKFYTRDEWISICEFENMHLQAFFESSIRFPKKKSTAAGFDELIRKYDETVINSYQLEINESEIYITEKVNNILFRK